MSTPSAWSSTADDYAKYAHAFTLPFAQKAFEFANLPTKVPLKILDVACGTGVLTEVAAKKFASQTGTTVLATDFAKGMVDIVKEKASSKGWTHVGTEVMDAMALDLSDASYNAVFCLFGVTLFPEAAKALAEFHRVLTPNGTGTITTWASQIITPLIMTVIEKIKTKLKPKVPVKGWSDLEYNIEQMHTAGFENVKGVHEPGVFVVEDLDAFCGMMSRNPGMLRDLLAGWNEEEIERFKVSFKEVIVEKFGVLERYEFEVVANIVCGEKTR